MTHEACIPNVTEIPGCTPGLPGDEAAMIRVTVRLYEELNDFIDAGFRKRPVEVRLEQPTTIEKLLIYYGVPPANVDLVLVNGNSSGIGHELHNGDLVSVYPVFESFDISGITCLSKRPLRHLRFVVDDRLGELARCMQLLGLDVEYREGASAEDLVAAVVNDRRILVSRNQKLLMRLEIDRGFLIRSREPATQLEELLARFNLRKKA